VNDRIGYIADDASYDTPIFEVKGSPVARGCAEQAIVRGLSNMIRQNMQP
jgi:neutral ceramidase